MQSIFSKLSWRHFAAGSVVLLVFICDSFIAGNFPWWNVVASIPPYSILLLPVCIALLAIKAKYKPFLLLCSLLVLIQLFPRADMNLRALDWSNTARGAEGEAAIQIMNWNTEFWDQGETPGQMYSFLQSHNQDIYILEEYEYLQETPVWKPYLIDKHEEIQGEFPDYYVLTEDQYAVISKYPITQHQLSSTKQVLWVTLEVEDKPLHIIAVHLEPHVDLGNSIVSQEFWNYVDRRHASRHVGIKEIEEFIKEAGAEPLVVTGDFNTTLLMGSLDQLMGQLKDAAVYSEQLFPTTWQSMNHFGWRIDHFLYNEYVDIHSYEAEPQLELSDHKALKVKLTQR